MSRAFTPSRRCRFNRWPRSTSSPTRRQSWLSATGKSSPNRSPPTRRPRNLGFQIPGFRFQGATRALGIWNLESFLALGERADERGVDGRGHRTVFAAHGFPEDLVCRHLLDTEYILEVQEQ